MLDRHTYGNDRCRVATPVRGPPRGHVGTYAFTYFDPANAMALELVRSIWFHASKFQRAEVLIGLSASAVLLVVIEPLGVPGI